MSTKKTSIDWFLVINYLLLVGIGWLAIYTADYNPDNASIFSIDQRYGRQFAAIVTCLFIAFIIQILDTRFYTAFAYLIYAFSLFFLILVLFLGSEISGSRSWFKLGFFNFQPSEIAKFATCLALAKYLSTLNISLKDTKQQITAWAILFLPVLLILLQGDAGSAVVYSALVLVMYREGLSGGYLLLGVLAVVLFILSLLQPFEVVVGALSILLFIGLVYQRGFKLGLVLSYLVPTTLLFAGAYYLESQTMLILLLIGVVIFLLVSIATKRFVYILVTFLFCCSIYVKGVDYAFNNFLKPHQQNRIGVILGTIEDKRGVGYNLNQSKIAIGSGGLWGKGFLQGTQNKGKFVPELSTDFIFCTIGEEFGFMGSVILIGLFILLLLRLIAIAERQKSKLTRVYAYGVASIIFFHFLVNIGMTLGLVPVIGIPLPFISYGGSSLLGFTMLLFILVKLDSERLMYLR
ncbi:MAG: rod shape-determining protein RodA [Chitinophagales bacterium]